MKKLQFYFPFNKATLNIAEDFTKFIIDRDIYNTPGEGFAKIRSWQKFQNVKNPLKKGSEEKISYLLHSWLPVELTELLNNSMLNIEYEETQNYDSGEVRTIFFSKFFPKAKILIKKKFSKKLSLQYDYVNFFS